MKTGSLIHVLFAEFSEPQAILWTCCSRIPVESFWWSSSIQCKIFLHLVLSFQLVHALKFEIGKSISLFYVTNNIYW